MGEWQLATNLNILNYSHVYYYIFYKKNSPIETSDIFRHFFFSFIIYLFQYILRYFDDTKTYEKYADDWHLTNQRFETSAVVWQIELEN
jgi:hypothetical protein